jgi:hypothetical protein
MMPIFLNPYYILAGVAIALMVFGMLIYVVFVRLFRIVVRPRTRTIDQHTINPIGVQYSDKIIFKEPASTPINEWDW